MVSGSDMHGTPILVAAEKEGHPPADVAGRFDAVNRAAFEKLGFSFDLFTSTRTIVHERTVQELFLALLEHGFVRRRTEEAPYCPQHRRFLPDRYLVGTCPHCGFESARGDECDRCGRPLEARSLGRPRCSLCGTAAELRPTEHFFLELDRLQPKLAEYLAGQRHWRPGTLRVAENFLEEGLHPTPITRDLDWGVPLPLDGYPTKRFYVWFDALTGYLSASKEWAIRAGRPEAWRRFWDARESVRQYYFVGKDNKFHHTIVWPSILIGVGGLRLPYDVAANEWLLVGGEKVSKGRTESRDAFVPSLLANYAPDVIRFYAAALAPENHDTELDWDEFHKMRDEILANQYGNLVQRALVLARDRFSGKVPPPPVGWKADSASGAGARIREAHRKITEALEGVRLKEALELSLEEVREANRRFHEARPWQASDAARAQAVYETVWRLRALATWLAPVLPFSSAEVFRMLGFAGPPGPGEWDRALEPVPPGQPLGEIRPLFPRSDVSGSAGGAAVPPGARPPGEAPPLAVRAGIVRSVSPHPSADRLYVLEVDAGEAQPRTIVAGLRSSYTEEALRGRTVVFVSNLAPRTIRRMTSQGMVLAVDTGERAVVLVPPDGTPPGTFVDGAGPDDRVVSYDEFASVALAVGRATATGTDGRTRVTLGAREITVRGDWPEGTVGVVRRPSDASLEGEFLSFGPGRAVRPSDEVPVGSRVR